MKFKRIGLAAAAIPLGVLIVSGCGVIGRSETETKTYEVAEKVSAVRLDSGEGDVEFVETGRGDVKVTEKLSWRGEKPKPEHRVEGGTLVLTYDCPDVQLGGSCGIDYVVEVPKGLAVDLETGAGDITLRALTGTIKANTGAGGLTGENLGAKKAQVESGAGDVELSFVSAPDDVEVRTGAGAGTVRVPDGSYRVDVGTGVGEEDVQIKNDPKATKRIKIETGAGEAKVLKL
ncbi:DUF4097 family beta strand repeat-containing protein [Bailinhaonella thermotolerans]|uniref:DUF4097 domain-containing protein n=1 Tax=Bailinhaonella thermotolerans TaxID=1070861 RepID=A0A3A4AY29_9ACTN|nr:DUF4097 family beta strand repeat-containing protein [Bailinhaonella thermotolerans]RJL26498.1 hypothetical protein D5H75_26300 [Bailinhaonella thermotolerans]